MALTVPLSGTTAGRSASIRVATPDTGEIIAGFGSKMNEVAGQWMAEQQDRQVKKAQLGLTRELGLARQEVEQIGDPAAIGPAWDERVRGIREKYLPEGTDPRVASRLDLAFAELTDRHALDLGNRRIGLEQSAVQADWLATRQEISAAAATSDGTTFQALLAQGEAEIDAREAKGVITPEQAAQERIGLKKEVYGNRADALITTDPQAFLTAVDAGEWNTLGDDLAPKQAAAKRAVAEMEVKALKDAEAAAKAQGDLIDKRLTEMRSIVAAGGTAVDEAYLNDPAVQARPGYAETRAAVDLKNATPGIKLMTPAQLDAQIAALEGKPVAEAYQLEKLKVLKTWRDEAAVKWQSDAVTQAQASGMAVPALPAFDPAAPQEFAKGVAARLSLDGFLRENQYTSAPAVFSTDELAALKPVLDPKGDPAARLALANSFLAQGPKGAEYLLRATKADPVFARATRLVAATGNSALAAEILKGQNARELKAVNVPADKDLTRIFDEVTGGIYDANPALKAEMIAASGALYAANAAGIDPEAATGSGWLENSDAVDLFSTAVQRVAGGSTDATGTYSIGGVQEVNGGKVVLPPGVHKDDVETTLDNLKQQLSGRAFVPDMGGMWANQEYAPGDPRLLRGFAAASLVPGKVPDLGPNASQLVFDLQMRRVGESDVYELTRTVNGRTFTIPQANDPNGTAYRFRLPELIRGAQK